LGANGGGKRWQQRRATGRIRDAGQGIVAAAGRRYGCATSHRNSAPFGGRRRIRNQQPPSNGYSSPISHPGTSLPFPNFLVSNLTARGGRRNVTEFLCLQQSWEKPPREILTLSLKNKEMTLVKWKKMLCHQQTTLCPC
jgi:hypothetical protein